VRAGLIPGAKPDRAWVFLEDDLIAYLRGQYKAGEAIAASLSIDAVNLLVALPEPHAGHVFLFRGQPIGSVKTAFMAACIRAGVGRYEAGGYQGFTWHGLRHTWATWHIQNGTPIEVLQKLGGWSDLRMVMNYAHHAPSHLASFADNSRKKHEDRLRRHHHQG